MKVSEITTEDIRQYLRLDDDTEEDLEPYRKAAVEFVKSYTGLALNEEELKEQDDYIDNHEDIYIAVMVLCQDMYDNRSFYVDNKAMNKTVETILGMYCLNLL